MKENSGGAMLLLLGGVIGVLIGIAIGVALLSYAYPVFQSDKWAAWVQAFGSIGAIVAALHVVKEGAEAQRRLQDRERELKILEESQKAEIKLLLQSDTIFLFASSLDFLIRAMDSNQLLIDRREENEELYLKNKDKALKEIERINELRGQIDWELFVTRNPNDLELVRTALRLSRLIGENMQDRAKSLHFSDRDFGVVNHLHETCHRLFSCLLVKTHSSDDSHSS